jgi:formylglycine-generating enzyme required for sulfatase activity
VGPCFEVGNLKPEFGKRLLDSWGKLTVQCNIQTGELARIAAERPVALKPLASATFDIDCPSIRESGAWKYVEGDTPEGWALRSRGWAVPDRPRWRHPELEMLFLWVPPGRFLMGTSGDPRSPCYFRYHHPSEQPARHADVPHGYWIAEMPVTDAVYWQFIRYQRHRRPVSWGRPHRLDGRPVVEVDYFDTLAFCQWLSSFGLMPPGCTAFGLPTEIQWEYAARGDTGQPYPWGTEPPDHDLACCGRDFGHGADRVGVRPLGRSPFGCQDMVGNVWEWCRDVWRPDHNLPRPGEAPLDPWLRVARGGSYFTAVHHAHCAMRTAFGMDARERNLGFRVICI